MLQARFSTKEHSRGGYLSYDRKFTSRKDSRSFKALSMLYNTKMTSTYHRSLIDELKPVSGLTPQIISNFARDYGISESVITNLSGNREEILIALSSIQPKFIEILHSILIGRDPTIEGGLALRFTVYSENIGDIVFIQPSGALVEEGPFDLIAYDHQGLMIWIFCIQGSIDSDDITKIVNPLLNQPMETFSSISNVYIVGQGYSWVAKQILKKYKGIVTRNGDKSRIIPFKLWTEEETTDRFQIKFKCHTI
jgi:hypothetical protein